MNLASNFRHRLLRAGAAVGAALFVSAIALSASAGPVKQAARRGRVDARQENQDARVDQGKRSGEITRGEAKHIEKRQRAVERAEARAKADGVVTAKEAGRIEARQDKASRTIRRAKHNDTKQPRAR